MRRALAIARRDLRAAFGAPLAWLLLFAWLLITGVLLSFTISALSAAQSTGGIAREPLYVGGFTWGSLVLPLLAPAVTMGAFAGERAGGTWPLLITAPLSDLQLVVGKFLATTGLLTAVVSGALVQPLLLAAITSIDPAQLAAGWLGLLLLVALLAALGTWISAAVDQPLVAFVLTFAVIMALFLCSTLAQVPGLEPLGRFLGLLPRLEPFLAGDVRAGGVAWFVGGTVACLAFAHGTLGQRRKAG